jgi:hypothetical protein
VKWCAAALYAGGADTVRRLHTLPSSIAFSITIMILILTLPLYSTGPDQTVSALTSFFLLMELYPNVQKKAQQEIDRVTGGNRLPTVDDYDALPYMRALVKEVIRWAPVAPIGTSSLPRSQVVIFLILDFLKASLTLRRKTTSTMAISFLRVPR